MSEDFPFSIDRIIQGNVSDAQIRGIIRFGLTSDLRSRRREVEAERQGILDLVQQMKGSPIALSTQLANEQHYEVPAEFFQLVLGRHLKYSCGYWPDGTNDLDASEQAMLELVCSRAGVQDGQEILDLGCGWGALSLYLAARHPDSRVLGLSNSRTQKEYIDSQIAARGLRNLQIETGDINTWETSRRFDRVLSIEMFEHLRNYEALLERVSSFMSPEARLFVHIFTHAKYAYVFKHNWMADAFFSDGLMPSDDLMLYFQKDVRILNHWRINGSHYQRTSEAWLEKLDRQRDTVLDVFRRTMDEAATQRALVSWRLFFLTCAESFGYGKGQEWMISHYLMEKQR